MIEDMFISCGIRLIVNTHTRSKPTLLPPILLHFRCLHLFDVGLGMVLSAATSAGISRLHNWYFMYFVLSIMSMITYCYVLKILLARRTCTLVISTRPTINLHATGERASVNFGHCISSYSVNDYSYASLILCMHHDQILNVKYGVFCNYGRVYTNAKLQHSRRVTASHLHFISFITSSV